MPILGFLLCGQLTGCFLIPTVAVSDCVCDMGQICNADKVCQNGVDEPPPSPQDAACIYNHDCDGSVCEYNSADIMANRCLSMDMLVFVGDPSNCNNVTADGTRQNPYCTINKAIDVVTTSGSGQAIRLLADVNYGSLDSSKFTGKSLTIYGPYEPRPNVNPMMANINLSNNTGPAVAVHDPKTIITLDGVVATTDASSSLIGALKCDTGASLNLRRSVIRNAKTWGVYADKCSKIGIDRTHFLKNTGAMSLSAVDTVSVTNSIIAENTRSSDASIFLKPVVSSVNTLLHLTIYNNRTSGAGAIERDIGANGFIRIENSIVMKNSLLADTQFYPAAVFYLRDVVVGTGTRDSEISGVGIESKDPVFRDPTKYDFWLPDDTDGFNRQCCLQKVGIRSDITIDIFGNPRQITTESGAVAR